MRFFVVAAVDGANNTYEPCPLTMDRFNIAHMPRLYHESLIYRMLAATL